VKLEPRELRVYKVFLVHLLMVLKDKKVKLVPKVLLELKVFKEHKAFKV
jgi:hypothetical protein